MFAGSRKLNRLTKNSEKISMCTKILLKDLKYTLLHTCYKLDVYMCIHTSTHICVHKCACVCIADTYVCVCICVFVCVLTTQTTARISILKKRRKTQWEDIRILQWPLLDNGGLWLGHTGHFFSDYWPYMSHPWPPEKCEQKLLRVFRQVFYL